MFRFASVLCLIFVVLYAEKIRFISFEHPAVTYYNTKYASYANMTSRRYGRSDPLYYVALNVQLISTITNNVSVSFSFYEYQSGRYHRSFVEMQFMFCDLVEKDKFFGSALRERLSSCPFSPGEYNLYNMTIPMKHIPNNFPITKGRIYCNLTGTATNELLGSGHVDMQIKEITIRKKP